MACAFNYEMRQLHQLNLDEKQLKLTLVNHMEKLGYQLDIGRADYKVKIVLSKGKDYHVLNKFFAKTSLSLYQAGQMQNYTSGQGKNYSSTQMAYTENMYQLAISKAVSHLPKCSN